MRFCISRDTPVLDEQCVLRNKCQFDYTLMPITYIRLSTVEAQKKKKTRKSNFLCVFFILGMKATHEHREV